MKKVSLLLGVIVATITTTFASIPENAIPFILDSHVYIQGTLTDTIPVSLIYDTGADRLYLDKDYMQLSAFGKSPLKKGKARMSGAGNDGAETVDIIINPLTLQTGSVRHTETITPVINLREILGRHTDGMIGNNALWTKPLIINYTEGYLLPIDAVTPDMTDGYVRLPAQFNDNRIDIECELRVDSFKILDELTDIVVSASYNTLGALSDRNHLGIIGNEILCHYDLIIDAPGKAIYAKRNSNTDRSYQKSSTIQMGYIDRTDICDGWIVNSLYENGISQAAGFEIGDIILEINNRPVKTISWDEQRKGLGLKGETTFRVQKKNGETVDYKLTIDKQII